MNVWYWCVPDGRLTNQGYIHGNMKAHLFNKNTGNGYHESYCKQYWQVEGSYEEITYNGKDKLCCKRCLGKYKKLLEE